MSARWAAGAGTRGDGHNPQGSRPALRMHGGACGNGRCMSHVTSLGGGQGGGELTQEMGAGQGGGELAREMHEGRRPGREKGKLICKKKILNLY